MKRKLELVVRCAARKSACVWLIFFVLCSGLFLSACSEDKEEPLRSIIPHKPDDSATIENQKKKQVVFDFNFSPGKDLIELADISVALTDTSGNVTTEKIISFPWKISLKGEIPCSAGYAITILPKESLVLHKDIYDFSVNYNNQYFVGSTRSHSFENNFTIPVSKNKVTEILDQMKDLYHYSYKVTR